MAVVRPCQNHRVLQLLVLLLLSQQVPRYTHADVTSNTHKLEVPSGGAAVLTCQYSPEYGPNPQIDWRLVRTDGSMDVMVSNSRPTRPFKDRIDVVTNGLYMKKVFPYDSGRYTCKVNSQDRKHTGQVAIQLNVKAPPSEPFSVVADNPMITRRRGTPVDLLCRHSPDFGPNPDVDWVFIKQDGSRELVYNKGQVIEKYRKRVKKFPWGLRINVTNVKDSGIYKCMVSSQDGSHTDEAEITLDMRRSRP